MGFDGQVEIAKSKYLDFIESCRIGRAEYGLTPRAEATAYACCFAIFGYHLLQKREMLEQSRNEFIAHLRHAVRSARRRYSKTPSDKPYRQLLAFALSALCVLNGFEQDPFADLVSEQIVHDVETTLYQYGVLDGRPQSGNHAMFHAIFLIHARDHLGMDIAAQLNQWVAMHQRSLNRFGFWGSDKSMRHLQFQNGYHQHEIFEYLELKNPQVESTIVSTRALCDNQGHFAPYPGGGGCYDYDAVFMLTPDGHMPDAHTEKLLNLTVRTLLSEQTVEGGWGESCQIRPRGSKQLGRFVSHVLKSLPNLSLFGERLRYALALQSSKHDRIHTHWSEYSRRWDEADLWDSWFRMLTIARVQVAVDPASVTKWGFINYPGIGYHPSLRENWRNR